MPKKMIEIEVADFMEVEEILQDSEFAEHVNVTVKLRRKYQPVKVKRQPMETAPKDGREIIGLLKILDTPVVLRRMEDGRLLDEDGEERNPNAFSGWFRVEVEG